MRFNRDWAAQLTWWWACLYGSMCKWERNVSTHNSYDLVCVCRPPFWRCWPPFLPCTSCVKGNEIQHYHFLNSPLQMSVHNNRRVLARSRKGRAIKYLHMARNKKERGKIDPNRNIEIKLLCFSRWMDSTFFSLQDEPPMQKWGVGHLSLCLRGPVIKQLFWLEFLYRPVYCVVVYVIVFLQLSITAWWSSFSKDDCHYFKFRGSFSDVWHLSFKHLKCTRWIEMRSSIDSWLRKEEGGRLVSELLAHVIGDLRRLLAMHWSKKDRTT